MPVKKKERYDLVYLTNTPSFYKLNLCQRIAERGVRLLLVLYGYGSEAVNFRLKETGDWGFDFRFINEGDSNARSKRRTFRALRRLMKGIDAKKILYAGWLSPEYNLYAFLSSRRRNGMVVESTVYESSLSGLKGWLKRRIIGRMSAALPSGEPHRQLLESAGFKDRMFTTGSVGIFHKPQRGLLPKTSATPLRFLYVGRLTAVKNLKWLVSRFNENGLQLTIVGQGEQEAELKQMAKDNVRFAGFIDNDRLPEVYRSHDVFVLPSISEPWGLVVEEALYHGLPVLASCRVGAAKDMVEGYAAGLTFDPDNAASFDKAVAEVAANYNVYARGASGIDWDAREEAQIQAYIDFVNS